MKKILFVAAIASLSACAASEEEQNRPVTGMANPASVYCEKIGGKLEIVKEESGDAGYCHLPDGERVEEWILYRRDNK